MKTVNTAFLSETGNPLIGLGDSGDIPEELYADENAGDYEERVRSIIQSQIVPHLNAYPRESRDGIRLALQYALSRDRSLGSMVSSFLLPFDSPYPGDRYFLWVWEALFPGESWQLPDDEEFEVIRDRSAARSARLPPLEHQ